MTTSEPTTGEIVRALKPAYETLQSVDDTYGMDAVTNAIDRLESQEREIERLKEELEQKEEAATVLHAANETHWTYIKELTARAEQAEKERDAAVYALSIYEDALFDECDKSYQSGFMDGFRSKEEMDDED